MELIRRLFSKKSGTWPADEVALWTLQQQRKLFDQLLPASRGTPANRPDLAPLVQAQESWVKAGREFYSVQLTIMRELTRKQFPTEDYFWQYVDRLVRYNREAIGQVPEYERHLIQYAPLHGAALEIDAYQARAKIYGETMERGLRRLRERLPEIISFVDAVRQQMQTASEYNRLIALSYWFAFRHMLPDADRMDPSDMGAWSPALLRTLLPWSRGIKALGDEMETRIRTRPLID